jgi:hypothetical protein
MSTAQPVTANERPEPTSTVATGTSMDQVERLIEAFNADPTAPVFRKLDVLLELEQLRDLRVPCLSCCRSCATTSNCWRCACL